MAPVAVPTMDDLKLDDPKVEKKPDVVNDEEGDDDDDDEVEAEGGDSAAAGDAKKKKKKKKPKKKKAAAVQSEPPRVGLSKIFKSGNYPLGQEVEYTGEHSSRMSSEEARERERLAMGDPMVTYNNIRRAGEVHRQVRSYARQNIKPGMSMTEIANMIEDGTRALVEEDGLESGIGFPTGLSVNEVAAHYTPNAGDTKVLQDKDVLKVDFGVHVKGTIVDSAFTMNFEPTWDRLLEAVKDATDTGVRTAGLDVRMCDIGDAIQEVMESYEVEVGGTTHQVKSIANLSGHSIGRYNIHGGKTVPIVKMHGSERDETKMEEGDYFAIETFGSTGRGRVIEQGACSHYALAQELPERYNLQHQSAKSLLKTIQARFGTLPFCRRYLDHIGEKSYLLALNTLVREGIVTDYPPLVDPAPGAMTAQYEHTILIRPTCKEIISKGDDY